MKEHYRATNLRTKQATRDNVYYEYTIQMVETQYGPENKIRLTRLGQWLEGPVIDMSEAMSENEVLDRAITELEELEEDNNEVGFY